MDKWYNENITNNSVIISSRVRLARNLKKYPFSIKINSEQSENLKKDVFEAIKKKGKFDFININEHSDISRLALFERHAISRDFLKNDREKGLVLSKDEKISIMVNEEDHIRIQGILSGENLDNAYTIANEIDDIIEEKLEYAFDKDYGYLSTCPTNVGTGLRASYMIHIPMLDHANQLSVLINSIGKFGMTMRGVFGEGTGPLGHIFQISNQITIGRNDNEIMANLKNITNQIIEYENQYREQNLKNKIFWEDKIYRALGILKHARTIAVIEARELLSYIRLGVIMEIIKDNCNCSIYNIMMSCSSANLQLQENKVLEETQRDEIRASYLRTVLADFF